MGRIPQLYILHLFKGKYQSGQMGQTVNLLAYALGGSNPSLPTIRVTTLARMRK